jgi:hydroxypyruvate isomerase
MSGVRLAASGERTGRVLTLENLTTAVDRPGVSFARAADAVERKAA